MGNVHTNFGFSAHFSFFQLEARTGRTEGQDTQFSLFGRPHNKAIITRWQQLMATC